MRMRLLVGVFGLVCGGAVLAQDAAPASAAATPAPDATAPAPAEPVAVAAEAGPATPGDVTRGEAKSAACGACHGLDGNSSDPQYPKIAGQHERYTSRQLALFKSGERQNPIMLGFATTLSPQDMRDIGAYFATKKAAPGLANEGRVVADNPETWVQRGERLFRGGDKTSGVPACMACHGPDGRGNPGSAYPQLAAQHADYTKAQLVAFRDGTVYGAGENANAIMSGVAAYLSDEDIEALATYIEGLHHAGNGTAEASAAP